MIYFDEVLLQINDARAMFEKLPKSQQDSVSWTDWYADAMVTNGVQTDKDELAMLLREADVAYHNEPEQHPWVDYLSRYISQELEK